MSRFLLLSLPVALAACGSTGDTVSSNLPSGPPAYRALVQETDDLSLKLDGLGADPIPGSTVAQYDGVLIVTDDIDTGRERYTGDARLTANFATEVLTGQADGFFYDTRTNAAAGGPGVAVPGNVSLSGRDFTAGLVDIEVSGTLDLAVIDGDLAGTFAGRDADMLVGVGDNSVDLGAERGWDALLIAD